MCEEDCDLGTCPAARLVLALFHRQGQKRGGAETQEERWPAPERFRLTGLADAQC